MEFRILGPLEAVAGGGALPLGTRKQRAVLALLLVNANRPVTMDDLVDELWPDGPPASAVANVRGYAGTLRRLFASAESGPDRMLRQGSSYLLRATDAELDLLGFAADAEAGRDELRRGDAKAAAARFESALERWRGPMFAGLPLGPALSARCAAVGDERLVITEELAAARLDVGLPSEAVGVLRDHVRDHPLRERGCLLLMRALHAVGDHAGALAVYRDGRAALAEQLGMEPGPELQQLHRTIIAGEPVHRPATPPRFRPVPAQLPPDVFGFTGRSRELAQLDAVLAAAGDHPTAVVISAIAGTAGVGKTATAVHWAQRTRDRFPDGQLYVNLRGFDPSGTPVSPAEAVRIFLDAFELPPTRIPTDLAAQVALYRSLLADRRMLVVLDNAHDADQVRPLLPGSAGSLVLVTSRNQLTGLVAAEGAHPITLDLLTRVEATDLLSRRLGSQRITAEPGAVQEIVTRCARLPLALSVVAARAAIRPDIPLTSIATDLHDARSALDALTADDPSTDVRAVFSWSYRTLSRPAARLFRLLGLQPGPDIGAPAVASLAGLPMDQVRRLLAELTHSHLLTERSSGRYMFHDLLRAYATDQAHAIDTETERDAAIHRLLDHYLHTAHAADSLRDLSRSRPVPPTARSDVTPERIADGRHAREWFITEHRNLLAAVERAFQAGLDIHAWQLPSLMFQFFRSEGHFAEWVTALSIGLNATRRLDDRKAQLQTNRHLATACAFLGRFEASQSHLRNAEDLCDPDHFPSRISVLMIRAWLAELQGRYDEALYCAGQRLELALTVNDPLLIGRAHDAFGNDLALTGDYERAAGHLQSAVAIQEEIGDTTGLASSLDNLCFTYHHLGRHTEAAAGIRRALELSRLVGERPQEARSLDHLGDINLALGDADGARTAWAEALAIYDEFGLPEADAIRRKLT